MVSCPHASNNGLLKSRHTGGVSLWGCLSQMCSEDACRSVQTEHCDKCHLNLQHTLGILCI